MSQRMKNELTNKADPFWIRCCELWDQLKPYERSIVVKTMEYMVGEGEEKYVDVLLRIKSSVSDEVLERIRRIADEEDEKMDSTSFH